MRVIVDIRDTYKSDGAKEALEIEAEEQIFSKDEKALIFLKSTSSGTYVLVDRFLGVTPFTFLPQNSVGSGLEKLQHALAEILRQSVRDDQINAMRVLQGFEKLDPDTISRLTMLSDSGDQEIALSAIAVLLKTKRLEDLERLKAYLDSHGSEDQPIAIMSISSELAQLQNPKTLSILQVLSGSKVISIKQGAMQAIRGMKSPSSGPTLIQRLDDSDGYVRYLAVITLAETFEKYGDYAPNMALFDKNPKFYTDLWKKWWAEEKPR